MLHDDSAEALFSLQPLYRSLMLQVVNIDLEENSHSPESEWPISRCLRMYFGHISLKIWMTLLQVFPVKKPMSSNHALPREQNLLSVPEIERKDFFTNI